ncbi:hypothetical protein [Mucilaginibacter auburnensis]|uniref:hypothetical protein n=1 Tax=Mucilaginibacter auburnensis TaxID=1457233 RepID=UPI000C23A0BE|nr:hypothetical protein [Mucilaginibacter auburnensis]
MENIEIYSKLIEYSSIAEEVWVFLLTQESLNRVPENLTLRDGLILNYFVDYDMYMSKSLTLLNIDANQFKLLFGIRGYETWMFLDSVSIKDYLIKNEQYVVNEIGNAKRLVNIHNGSTFEDLVNRLGSSVMLLNKNRMGLIYK